MGGDVSRQYSYPGFPGKKPIHFTVLKSFLTKELLYCPLITSILVVGASS